MPEPGFQSVKLYGIVGLPHEEQADLEGTDTGRLPDKKTNRQLRIVFGVSSSCRKAQTPFQWWGKDKKSGRKRDLRKDWLLWASMCGRKVITGAILSLGLWRGDRRFTGLLRTIARQGNSVGAWKQSFKQQRTEDIPGFTTMLSETFLRKEFLPWTHLTEVEKNGCRQKATRLLPRIWLGNNLPKSIYYDKVSSG